MDNTVRLTDTEISTLVNALVVAAEQYLTDSTNSALPERIRDQFKSQVAECDRLVFKLETA